MMQEDEVDVVDNPEDELLIVDLVEDRFLMLDVAKGNVDARDVAVDIPAGMRGRDMWRGGCSG